MSHKLILFYCLLVAVLSLRLLLFYSQQKTYQSGEQVNFTTQILTKPKIYASYQIVYVNLDQTTKVLIKTSSFPELNYGDYIRVSGTLKQLLLKDNVIIFTLNYPKIEANIRENNSLLAVSLFIRQKIIKIFQTNLDFTSAGLLLGIVFGIKENLPKEFINSIQITGVMHVIAASGMNVTMVAGFLFALFALFFKRQLAVSLSILGILFYTTIAGFEPSIIRAAIMGVIVFSAQILGRQQQGLNTLLITGFVMLFFSPAYLFDVGFQLSFAATLGLLYIPIFFTKIKNNLTEVFIITISAQIATLPILISNFGNYSLWSVVVNALVLWTIPVLMILGSFAAISGFIFEPLARLFLYLCLPFLYFFEKVVAVFGSLGLSFTCLPAGRLSCEFPWQFSTAYYLCLLSLIAFKFKRR